MMENSSLLSGITELNQGTKPEEWRCSLVSTVRFQVKLFSALPITNPIWWGFPGGSVVKSLPANAGDASLIPGLRRSPGEGNGNMLQYSRLGYPIDRGAR